MSKRYGKEGKEGKEGTSKSKGLGSGVRAKGYKRQGKKKRKITNPIFYSNSR